MKDDQIYILDRIEGQTAILCGDGGDIHRRPLCCLPKGAKEGMAFLVSDGRYVLMEDEGQKRRELMQQKVRRLLGKNTNGEKE